MSKVSKKVSKKAPQSPQFNAETPYNGPVLEEIEHFHLDILIWIYYNWDKLGNQVGKAFVNGELVDNESFKTIIENLIAHSTTSEQLWPLADNKVTYEQGELQLGRYQAKNFALINMARPVRHTIANALYQDIDFVNCHLYIYKFLCEKYDLKCPSIKDYIKNREKHWKDLADANPQLTNARESGKKWFLQLLNGGLGTEVSNKTEFMAKYEKELKGLQPKLAEKIDEEYPQIRPHVVKKNGANTWNLQCKTISKVLENYENQMRHYLCEFVRKEGFDFSSHCYDGGMSYLPLNKKDIKKNLDLKKTSEYIREKTKIDCPLKFKDFDEMIPITEKQLKDITIEDYKNIKKGNSKEYEGVKYRFEKNNFFCEEQVAYYYENNNKLFKYSVGDFIAKYIDITYEALDKEGEVKQEQFINKWIRDFKKRRYENVIWSPIGGRYIINDEGQEEFVKSGAFVPKYIYNTWKGFHIQKVINDDKQYKEELDFLLNNFRRLVNNEEIHYNYLIKWMAHLFQKPHRKTEVCVGLKSVIQGIGKTSIYDLMTKMMGQDLTAKIENPERDLFGDFNELIANVIFILLEEWDANVNIKYQKRMLDAISGKQDNINIKGGGKSKEDSFTNYMCVWNTYGMRIVESDRRVWALENVGEKPGSKYFDDYFKLLENEQVLKRLYDYLMRVDISDFHPAEDRTKTALREQMIIEQRDKIYYFLKDLIIRRWRIKNGHEDKNTVYSCKRLNPLGKNDWKEDMNVLHQDLGYWARDNNSKYSLERNTFTTKIKGLKTSAMRIAESNGKTMFYLNIDEGIQWLKDVTMLDDRELQNNDNDTEETKNNDPFSEDSEFENEN